MQGVFETVYEGINVSMQNGKLDDVEIAYYVNKIKKMSKGKELRKISFIIGNGYMDLRYAFKNYPFERIWRVSIDNASTETMRNVNV